MLSDSEERFLAFKQQGMQRERARIPPMWQLARLAQRAREGGKERERAVGLIKAPGRDRSSIELHRPHAWEKPPPIEPKVLLPLSFSLALARPPPPFFRRRGDPKSRLRVVSLADLEGHLAL